MKNKVFFFKTHGDNGGTIAAALLWAWSDKMDPRLREIRQDEDGFWTVPENLLSQIQQSYDANFVIATAA